MLLLKTDKARQELAPGMRTLSLRERSLLLLADGKPLQDLQAMYHGLGAQMVDQLVHQGYLSKPASRQADHPFAASAGATAAQQGLQDEAVGHGGVLAAGGTREYSEAPTRDRAGHRPLGAPRADARLTCEGHRRRPRGPACIVHRQGAARPPARTQRHKT